jgi:outer membrane protein assembly factor BamB
MSPRTYENINYNVRPPRRSLLGSVVGIVVTLLAIAGGGLAGRWYFTTRSLGWQVERGRELLTNPEDPRLRLDAWEAETRAVWQPRREEFIKYLYAQRPWEDVRLRALLLRVCGADYGDRREDWERWYDGRKRERAGEPLKVPRADAVKLELRWEAAIGLTAWYTTIIPLDGQIYIASLGESFDATNDPADGVVRVDGTNGAAELIFSPPDRPGRGPRDVLGVAAGENGLFAACQNGTLFSLDADGEVRWEQHVGGPIVSAPLAVDINGDERTDVMVVTSEAKVVALNGQNGRTLWVASLPRPPASADLLGATLALGDVLPGQGLELIATTPPGAVEVLTLKTGRSRWRHDLRAGTLAGAICRGGRLDLGLPALVGDRAANIWSLTSSSRSLEPVIWAVLGQHAEDMLIAAARTVRNEPDGSPLLIVCPTGDFTGDQAGVCAVAPEGLLWRWPVRGAIWGSPAVADLNGDLVPEIVLTSIEADATGNAFGVLTIVSGPDPRADALVRGGHPVARLTYPAPAECSPVVADVDGDNYLEVLVADQAGILHCYGTGKYGPVKWGCAGGDSHNTRNAANAFSFGQAPFKYQRQWEPERQAGD